MYKWNVLWLGLLLSCGTNTADTNETGGSDTGTSESEEPYFNQEIELNTVAGSASSPSYLPLGWYNVLAVAFEPPPPPYEIRSLAIMAINDGGSFSHGGKSYQCSAAAPLELVAWVDESAEPSSYLVTDAHGVAQLPALVSGMTTGPTPEEGEWAEPMTVEFETPLRVNTPGTLYVAARRQETGADIAPCIRDYTGDGSQVMWAHHNISEIAKWGDLTSIAHVRVLLGTHQGD